MFARRLFVSLLAAALLPACMFAGPQPHERSTASPLAARTLLLDIARAGERLVAVGDRGHVVLSDDEGLTWRQVIVPTRAMLTGVAFGDARSGWAVGHDGVILATTDGGESWSRRDRGEDLETVFLDVHFSDSRRGFLIGAYGKYLETEDAGVTWEERQVHDEDLHFNRISSDAEGRLYIAGEAGLILVSKDGGTTWARSEPPYEGSFFGVRPMSGGVLIAYGLRGTILVSTDGAETWERRETEVRVLLMACARPRDGVAVVAGQGGNFYISRDAGRTFRHWKPDGFGTSVAELAIAKDGAVVTVGEAGAVRLMIP